MVYSVGACAPIRAVHVVCIACQAVLFPACCLRCSGCRSVCPLPLHGHKGHCALGSVCEGHWQHCGVRGQCISAIALCVGVPALLPDRYSDPSLMHDFTLRRGPPRCQHRARVRKSGHNSPQAVHAGHVSNADGMSSPARRLALLTRCRVTRIQTQGNSPKHCLGLRHVFQDGCAACFGPVDEPRSPSRSPMPAFTPWPWRGCAFSLHLGSCLLPVPLFPRFGLWCQLLWPSGA